VIKGGSSPKTISQLALKAYYRPEDNTLHRLIA